MEQLDSKRPHLHFGHRFFRTIFKIFFRSR